VIYNATPSIIHPSIHHITIGSFNFSNAILSVSPCNSFKIPERFQFSNMVTRSFLFHAATPFNARSSLIPSCAKTGASSDISGWQAPRNSCTEALTSGPINTEGGTKAEELGLHSALERFAFLVGRNYASLSLSAQLLSIRKPKLTGTSTTTCLGFFTLAGRAELILHILFFRIFAKKWCMAYSRRCFCICSRLGSLNIAGWILCTCRLSTTIFPLFVRELWGGV
jgi:hypothetical protein